MKRSLVTTLIFIVALLQAGSEVSNPFDTAEPAPPTQVKDFPVWDFCVAYQLRDVDERDRRPTPSDDPFRDSEHETHLPLASVLIPLFIIDTAAMLSRTVAQKTIKHKTAKEIVSAVLAPAKDKKQFPAKDCYDPHHIIIFYQDYGIPVAAIEVCFTCNSVKGYMRDRIDESTEEIILNQQADLLKLATILNKVGLPLAPYKSLDEFKKEKLK